MQFFVMKYQSLYHQSYLRRFSLQGISSQLCSVRVRRTVVFILDSIFCVKVIMKFFQFFTKCFSRQDIEDEQVSQEDIENEDQSNGDNAVPWICLFENPGLQHIGRKILLEVPFHLEFRPFEYRNKKNFLGCRLVCKTFKDVIDDPSFWLQKMELNFTLDYQLWKKLVKTHGRIT